MVVNDARRVPPRAWSVVFVFGLVSLFADMVYEGARSLSGPVLLALGASSAVVGLVAGAGEAMALVLRLFAGPVADRRGAHWGFTIVGYGLTAVCVPLLAVLPKLGVAGLLIASLLILAERTGKAVRSPSKSALLAHAARAVGRGKGFGVHKALDQLGAFAGPLSVAAVISFSGSMWTGLAWLAVPGVVAMIILLALRARVPDMTVYDPVEAAPRDHATGGGLRGWWRDVVGADLPKAFFGYAIAASLTTGGLVTFAVISVHLTRQLGVEARGVPMIYAGAMLVEAVTALLTGWVYDRLGTGVLFIVPVFVAVVPWLAFGPSLAVGLVGVGLWAAATAVQDSTIKALVAELVPGDKLASAYGIFAAIQGAFAIVGGFVAGWLLDRSIPVLGLVIGVTQIVALVMLVATARRTAKG